MRRWLLIGSGLLLIVLAGIAWRESQRIKPIPLTPTLTGQVEYCLTCHSNLAQISASHPVQTFGCVVCHGGERLALDANLAHSTMRGGANPSDYTVVQASCGGASCHSGTPQSNSDHIQRATTSIQNTYAGAIASMLYTYGAEPDLVARFGTSTVQDPASTTGITQLSAFSPPPGSNPALLAFAANCLNCHISAQPLTGARYFHFTGCAACHTPTQTVPGTGAKLPPTSQIHTLTTAISYTQCDTCHNRGNYDLRTMTFQARTDLPIDRLHDYYQPIAQFTSCEWKLDCVDCHSRQEAMGDGSLYGSEAAVQYVQCKTCHGTLTDLPQTRTLTDTNDLAFRMATVNPVVHLTLGDTILVTSKGEPLWNSLVLSDGTVQLVGKATGQKYTIPMVKGSACQQNPARQDSASCHQCHSVQR
jgi:hypothetical protein